MKKVLALLALALASVALVACGDDNGGTATTTETSSEATKGTAQTGEATKGDAAAGEATEGAGATGGGGGGGEAGGGSKVMLEADPGGGLSYTTSTASAKAGNVTIEFDNPQPLEHDVDVEDSGGAEVGGTELVSSGSTSVTLQGLKPGSYTFYCSVPGHRESGMEGTLTVK